MEDEDLGVFTFQIKYELFFSKTIHMKISNHENSKANFSGYISSGYLFNKC